MNKGKYCFIVEEYVDETGTAEYVALREQDYDTNGIPIPWARQGIGETPIEAIISLCEVLDDEEV